MIPWHAKKKKKNKKKQMKRKTKTSWIIWKIKINMSSGKENTFASGQMSLESLWRLLEQQGRTNTSMASVVGLDEAKILVQDRAGAPKHGMTTIGNYPQNKLRPLK
jgi:hypothetical protein